MALNFDRNRGTNYRNGVKPIEHLEISSAKLKESSATQEFDLGARVALTDGRVFRYCKDSGSGLAAGKLVGSDITLAERTNNISAAVDAGSNYVTITAVGTITADEYAGGFMYVCNDTGEGLMYSIEGNDAIAAAGTGNVYLNETIVTALDTTSDIVIVKSMWSTVTLNPDVIRKTIGVPVVPVTASHYFWCQTKGPAVVLCGDSTGNAATERWCHPAAATGEFVTTAGGVGGTEIIGTLITDSTDMVDTEYHMIYLNCE